MLAVSRLTLHDGLLAYKCSIHNVQIASPACMWANVIVTTQ